MTNKFNIPTNKFGKVTVGAVATAVYGVLQDEKRRTAVLAAGANVAAKAKSWKGQRPQGSTSDSSRSGLPSLNLRALSRQGRLEKRVAAVADAIGAIRRGKAVGETLSGADGAIEQLRTALTVADKLPRSQAGKIHEQVEGHLDELEAAAGSAVLKHTDDGTSVEASNSGQRRPQ